MSYTPSAAPRLPQKKNDNKGLVIFLSVALAACIIYIIYDKIQDGKVVTQNLATVNTLTQSKDSLKAEFDVVLHKLDTLNIDNSKLKGDLAAKSAELQKQKEDLKKLFQKKSWSDDELKKAKQQIAALTEQVNGFVAEIEKLRMENKLLDSANQQLTADKANLTTEKNKLQDNLAATSNENKNLAEKLDVASTLQISGIEVKSLEVNSKGKESEAQKAKNVSLLRISCLLNGSRVTESGSKTLYVVVYNPDGSVSGSEGTIKLREGGEKPYTNKVEVNYEKGRASEVSFNWKPDKKFVPGTYKIEIYNNGFKIGEANKELKKGGWF